MTAFAARLVRPLAVRISIVPVLVLLALGAAVALRALDYRGEAMPGVRILGADVGGRGRADVARTAWVEVRKALARPVTIRARGGSVTVVPASVLRVDVARTTAAALDSGRGGAGEVVGLVDPGASHDVAPAFLVRKRAAARLFARIQGFGRAPVDARVRLEGLTPVAAPGRTGLALDRTALLAALQGAVGGRTAIRAAFHPAAPVVSSADAAAAAEQARIAVSAPVRLTFGWEPVGTLEPERLARLIRFERARGALAVTFDPKRLARAAAPFVQQWRARARNAQFAVDGERVRVIPSRDGRDVDPETFAAQVTAAALGSRRDAEVTMQAVPAERTTAEAQALGITRKLVSFTTDMGVSSSNRIHNVQLMADYIDGTVIEPGETFSFNRVVGPRTPERGFLEGQMIVGSLVLPSIGGGVCQTATTLFNDAFELGLPIVERHNHSLYISHYPLGRDATVSWGGPDLVFRNDMAHGLLIRSSYTSSTLTFTFYGTPEGRRVVSQTGERSNWKAPTMTYAIDPRAPRGSAKVVSGSGASGFDITVKRQVYDRHGRLIRKGAFPSRYIPEGPTTVYGPGVTPPGPYYVIPTA
jgi:vancomycin resistance protein YoaR